MTRIALLLAPFVLVASLVVAQDAAQKPRGAEFPAELVEWVPYEHNPVFTGAGPGAWDAKIRERGWIAREGESFRMWYTGYDGQRTGKKMLGYATSTDGLAWKRYPEN